MTHKELLESPHVKSVERLNAGIMRLTVEDGWYLTPFEATPDSDARKFGKANIFFFKSDTEESREHKLYWITEDEALFYEEKRANLIAEDRRQMDALEEEHGEDAPNIEEGGTMDNPINFSIGDEVVSGLWYLTDEGYFWEAKKSGTPSSETDEEYFDIPEGTIF